MAAAYFDDRELLQAAELLQQAANDLNGNVGVGAVIGGLCVHLR